MLVQVSSLCPRRRHGGVARLRSAIREPLQSDAQHRPFATLDIEHLLRGRIARRADDEPALAEVHEQVLGEGRGADVAAIEGDGRARDVDLQREAPDPRCERRELALALRAAIRGEAVTALGEVALERPLRARIVVGVEARERDVVEDAVVPGQGMGAFELELRAAEVLLFVERDALVEVPLRLRRGVGVRGRSLGLGPGVGVGDDRTPGQGDGHEACSESAHLVSPDVFVDLARALALRASHLARCGPWLRGRLRQ